MNLEIENLKKQLLGIGPFHPGKITQQFVRCGKKNCKCRDTKTPQKHGPYYQLSYGVGKKNSTVFLKQEDLPSAQRWLEEFEKFKQTTEELIHAYVKLAKKTRWKQI